MGKEKEGKKIREEEEERRKGLKGKGKKEMAWKRETRICTEIEEMKRRGNEK